MMKPTGTASRRSPATTARDGRTVVFLHRHDGGASLPRDARRDIDYVDCPAGIEAQHVLASSAIPVAFPPQRITQPQRP